MAKTLTYIVSFTPAQRTTHGFTVTVSLLIQGEKHEVEAASLADLEAHVRKLAQAFGQTCSLYVRLKDRNARKPAGFDRWLKGIEILDWVHPDATEIVLPVRAVPNGAGWEIETGNTEVNKWVRKPAITDAQADAYIAKLAAQDAAEGVI
jgi:hypothetical protein